MKVAVVDPSLFTIPYDGALCDALAGEGCEVGLFGRTLRGSESAIGATPIRPFFYRISERLLHGRLPPAAFRLAKGAEHALDMLRLRRYFSRRFRPDVIHFQWAPLPAVDRRLAAAFRRIAPTVLTVHDSRPFNGAPPSRLQQFGATALFGAFDHLIVHTEAARGHLLDQGIPAARVSVIPHGLLPTAGAAGWRAAGQGSGDGRRTILLFGKLRPYKGLDVLVEAYARLPADLRAAARLRIVGEPLMPLDAIRARVTELGIGHDVEWDLRYVGDAEIGAILGAADILAFPYRDIDASGVLMSAVPYGKPIVASSLGVFAAMLKDGVHGRLVPPNDPAALADALASLIADPAAARRMGDAVRALDGEIPGWGDIAGRTVDLYRRLIDRRPQPAGEMTAAAKRRAMADERA
jgi:glycosyltransferase involved in cell wall biosynthesis